MQHVQDDVSGLFEGAARDRVAEFRAFSREACFAESIDHLDESEFGRIRRDHGLLAAIQAIDDWYGF